METEQGPVRSHDSEPDNARADGADPGKPPRSPRKTLLIAAIASVITIGALVVLRGQSDTLHSATAPPEHGAPALHETAPEPRDAESREGGSTLASGGSERVLRAIEGLSERTNQWFESLSTERASMSRELTRLATGMSAIQGSIAELQKSNDELKQRISDAQTRLQAIAKDVRGLKIATKKKVTAQRKRVASAPPFVIDAIDLWDDAVYVAVSQDGHAAFLREGEQRAGWRVTNIDRLKGQVAFRGPEGQDYSTSIRRGR